MCYNIYNEREKPYKANHRKRERKMKRYQVRTKEYEKKNWKVVESFDTMKEAKKFAIRTEMSLRRTERMFDSWDIKDTVTKERFIIAE